MYALFSSCLAQRVCRVSTSWASEVTSDPERRLPSTTHIRTGVALNGGCQLGKLERGLERWFYQLEDLGDIAILGEPSKRCTRQHSSGSHEWQPHDFCNKCGRRATTRPPAEVRVVSKLESGYWMYRNNDIFLIFYPAL